LKHEPTQSWRARGARLGVGGVAILLAIMTSVFGALNGNLLAKPRVAYAMARDGCYRSPP
jgi:amino acid transporter